MTISLMLSVVLALILDKVFAEPKRYHPLVGFGNYAKAVENRFNQGQDNRAWILRIKGAMSLVIVVLPWLCLSVWAVVLVNDSIVLNVIVSALVLYIAVGWQSLLVHAKQVATPLYSGDLELARQYVSWIVSRDTEQLNQTQVAKAATESVLENGADAIFAAVFWFCVLGVPGVVLYRCVNTLDAMWGYKNERFLYFGWAAARLDDLLNYIPARLTALSYALLAKSGFCVQAFRCWQTQGYIGKSPNAGPVMASGAGALNVSLGGAASYHNRVEQKPILGPEPSVTTDADVKSIYDACDLVNRTLALWVLTIFVIVLVTNWKL